MGRGGPSYTADNDEFLWTRLPKQTRHTNPKIRPKSKKYTKCEKKHSKILKELAKHQGRVLGDLSKKEIIMIIENIKKILAD